MIWTENRCRKDVIEQINISIKYEGYIKRQMEQVHQFKKLEKRKIPATIDYDDVSNLRKRSQTEIERDSTGEYRAGVQNIGRFPCGYLGAAGVFENQKSGLIYQVILKRVTFVVSLRKYNVPALSVCMGCKM